MIMKNFLSDLGMKIWDFYTKDVEVPKISPNRRSIFDSDESFEIFALGEKFFDSKKKISKACVKQRSIDKKLNE
jgi:hypothetical protein